MSTNQARPGGLSLSLREFAKRIAFRSKWLNGLSRPRYPFLIEPAQIAWLVNKIDETRSANEFPGSIIEVGVARGMTTVFLLEHMQRSNDTRPYYCIDTFSGFVEADVAYEEKTRSKDRSELARFAYNSRQVFENNIKKAGYANASMICSDASLVDFSKIGPVDVMLLDVDLYLPTKNVLTNAWKHLNRRSFVMVDDCQSDTEFDGANQAYQEFCKAQGRPLLLVGNRAGTLEKV